jgi:putative lipoprotein (rSAM/lipoprotein system)
MIRKFKKHLSVLFAGSFTMVLAACYGMPVDFESDITVNTVNEVNEAIPGLKVTLTKNGERIYEDYTDSVGNVYYEMLEFNGYNGYNVKIEDIDGEENGGEFLSETLNIDGYQEEYTVEMNKE